LEKSTESIIHEISSKEPRRIIERVRELVTLSAVTSVSLEKPGKILNMIKNQNGNESNFRVMLITHRMKLLS
jgi:hypothetical protein